MGGGGMPMGMLGNTMVKQGGSVDTRPILPGGERLTPMPTHTYYAASARPTAGLRIHTSSAAVAGHADRVWI